MRTTQISMTPYETYLFKKLLFKAIQELKRSAMLTNPSLNELNNLISIHDKIYRSETEGRRANG